MIEQQSTQTPDIQARALSTWQAVVAAADGQCQCTGACGRPHRPGNGRCVVGPGWTGTLVAAPANPTLAFHQAAALPPQELRAWCPACWKDAVRKARAAQRCEACPDAALF